MIVAQTGNAQVKISQLQKTKQKIINLLDEVGDKEKLRELLEVYVQEFPMDLDNRKRLGFLYLDSNMNNKAREIFKQVYQINPSDKDSAIVMADELIEKGQHSQAFKFLKPFVRDKDLNIDNRLEGIYVNSGSKDKANEICERYKNRTDFENYTLIELQSRCLARAGNLKDAIALVHDYSLKHPSDRSSLSQLAYYYLESKDIDEANRIINLLKDKNASPKTIKDLERYMSQTKDLLKLERSWEHSLNYEYWESSDNSYWSTIATLVRNVKKYSLGARIHRAEPSRNQDTLGYNAIDLKYYHSDNLMTNIYAGNNFGKSTKAAYGGLLTYNINTNLFFQFTTNNNTQIFNLPIFADANEAIKSDHTFYFEYNRSLENRITFFAQREDYLVDEESAKQQNFGFQYNHYLTSAFSAGVYLYEAELLESTGEIEESLLNKSSIRALNMRYEFHFNQNKAQNTSTLYIGADSAREIDFGEYATFINQTTYRHSRRKEAYFTVEWNKESLAVNENESIRFNLGYSFWFL